MLSERAVWRAIRIHHIAVCHPLPMHSHALKPTSCSSSRNVLDLAKKFLPLGDLSANCLHAVNYSCVNAVWS